MALSGLAPLGARAGRIRLTPEQEDSLLGELAGAGTSALGLIGNVLDTPGAFVRNILAGENPLPGILDPEQRVSGRDLLERHGILGENYEGFDMGDVAGFGAEIATDPLTLVGGGITKSGGIAKQLGKFPKRSLFDAGTGVMTLGKRMARRGTLASVLEGADDATMKLASQLAEKRGGTLADFLDEPMQRSLGVGLPFQENAFTFDLPGAAGRAARLDKIGGAVRASAPARYLAKMFDSRAGDVGDWAGQTVKLAASDEAEPAKMAAGAQLNRFHLDLNAHGIADQDLQTDILEGITRNPDAPQGTRLSEQEILDYNVQPLPGEAPEALQARKLAIRDVRKSFHDSQEALRVEKEKLGLPAARYESQRVDYLPREATFPQYENLNTGMRRRDPLRELGRTEVDAILKDDQLRELSKQTEIDPLSPEQLTRKVPPEVERDLANMGYEDLQDLVPWQADHMRNADPERAAMNYRAVQSTALGITPENPLSRTTALPKPKLHTERMQEAVRRADELLGRNPEDWDRMPEWLDQARELPKLQKELEELRQTALAGDYAAPLADQEVAIQLQLGNAEQAREAYRAAKGRLDARDIFSRERPDEWFDWDRMTDDEKTLLEVTQQRAGFDNHGYRTQLAELDAQAESLRAQIERLGRTTAKGEMSVKDATKNFTIGQAVKAIRKQESEINKLTEQLQEVERQAALYRSSIDEGVAAKNELAEMEKSFRERGYFQQGESPYLADKEIDQLAALRGQALEIPKWRARLKKVQERIARGEREMAPGELMDNLQAEIGAAEVAQAQLDALAARAREAKYFVKHARDVPQEAIDKGHRFYGNAAMHDATVQRYKDIEKLAFTKQAHKSFAANATYIPPGTEVDKTKFVPWTEAMRSLGVGKTATQQANAIRAFAEEARKYGKLTDDEFQNIAGPHAVATSAVKQDPVLAQELRNAELGDFVKGITAEYEKRVKLVEGKFTGAERAKQLADLEERFKVARTQGIESIAAKPLDDTSHAGRLMQVKRTMADKLRENAAEARLSGQMDDEAYQSLRDEIDDWLKGTTKGTSEEVQRFQQMWEQAVAKDPIPNDGLLRMRNMYVPKDLADSLANAAKFRGAPKSEGFLGWVDWWRNLTKGHLTMPFPGFHVRNLFNMAYQYGNAGVRDPRHGLVQGFLQPWKDAWQVLQGRVVNDFDSIPAIKAMGLKGDDAHRQLVAAAESYGGLQGAGDIISEGAEPAFIPFGKKEHDWGSTTEMYTAALPGGRPLDRDYILEPLAAKFGKSRFNPANVKQFAPIALGARLSNTTENVGRLATFIGLLRQGYGFEEAGALMKAMHVDYSRLTQFERSVARRFAPFYSWSRGMVPYAIKQFIEKPAGLYAQTARLARVAEQDAGFLPPQLGGSLAIPIGQEEDGTQRYLSQMDFPAEVLNKLVAPGKAGLLSKDTFQNTVRGVIAQSDPLAKFFVEQGFGKSAFRGRNLDELESTTGRLAANLIGAEEPLWKSTLIDNALANSPASRYLGTVTQIGDDRKGWLTSGLNTMTGLKIADVDMDKQRSIAAGQAAKELMKATGAKTIESINFSKDQLAAMDPATRAEAEQLQAVLRALSREARAARKKEK